MIYKKYSITENSCQLHTKYDAIMLKKYKKKVLVVKVINFCFHEATSTYPIVLLNQSHVSGNNFRTRIFGSDVEVAEISDVVCTLAFSIKATGWTSISIS